MDELLTPDKEGMPEWDRRLLRLVADHPAPAVIHDGRHILFANAAVARALGMDEPSLLVGRTILETVYPDDRAAVAARSKEVFQSHVGAPLREERFIGTDGRVYYLEVATQYVELGGHPVILVTGRDLTDQRHAERTLALGLLERETIMRVARAANAAHSISDLLTTVRDDLAAFVFARPEHTEPCVFSIAVARRREPLPAGASRSSDESRFASFRAALETASSFDAAGLAARVIESREPCFSIDVTRDPDFPQAATAAACGIVSGAACPIVLRNDVIAVLQWFAERRVEPDPELEPALVAIGQILSNVAERERAHQDRERLVAQLRAALDAEKIAVAQRDEFVSIAAHELYTPITSLELALESISVPAGADASRRFLEIARRQADRLVTLVESLLDVSRIETGRFELAPVPLDLAQLVRDVCTRFEDSFHAARTPLEIEAPEPVTGVWDRSRLDQVVTNLLSNAVKYGAGNPVLVSVGRDHAFARLRVNDHGIGIEPSRLPRIFERFERAVPTENFGGLGLGLFIVREIVERHGGTTTVESSPAHGTTFEVRLPLARGR